MSAYYNENDPFAAQWLRNLINANLIALGEVDERSIVDVRPDDLKGFVQCHFFAGIGGWSYALRLSMWPDDRPVWTGSCPCQPFSQAGKREGFTDERHLWPAFVRLIGERKPSILFGEQVASATEWLRLVRSDLEALGYAVGAIPIEAASAGADHLRDRFFFVGHAASERGNGCKSASRQDGRHGVESTSGVGLADATDTRSQGRPAERECAGERAARSHGVADAHESRACEEREQRSGQFGGAGRDQETCACDVPDAPREQVGATGQPRQHGDVVNDTSIGRRKGRPEHEVRCGRDAAAGASGTEHEWVIGADGKTRRVKSGIRLLVNGFPNRVGILRGFGNAIDPRPAKEFISAFMECQP
jgi:DNA (cytosine-5)-methyltransferase 1